MRERQRNLLRQDITKQRLLYNFDRSARGATANVLGGICGDEHGGRHDAELTQPSQGIETGKARQALIDDDAGFRPTRRIAQQCFAASERADFIAVGFEGEAHRVQNMRIVIDQEKMSSRLVHWRKHMHAFDADLDLPQASPRQTNAMRTKSESVRARIFSMTLAR